MKQRGFTLLETLIAAAIIIIMTGVVIGMSQAARPFGVRSAIDQFDALMFDARELAQISGNGATVIFTAPKLGAGFSARLYSGRPNGKSTMAPADVAPMSASADITEAMLGGVPFTVFINSAGHVTGMKGAIDPAVVISDEPPCPDPDYHMHFAFTDGRAHETRTLACRQVVGGDPDFAPPQPTDTPNEFTPLPSPSPIVTPTTSSSPASTPTPIATPTIAPTQNTTSTPSPCPSGEVWVAGYCTVPNVKPSTTPGVQLAGALTLRASCSSGSGGHCYGWTGMICNKSAACLYSPSATVTAGWALAIPSAALLQGLYSETDTSKWQTLTVLSPPKDIANALHLRVSGGTLSLEHFFNGPSGGMQWCEVYVQPFILWVDGARTQQPDFPNILFAYGQYYPSSRFLSISKITQHVVPKTPPYWSIQTAVVGSTGTFHSGQLDWYGAGLGSGRYTAGLYYWTNPVECRYGNGDWSWVLKNFSIEVWQGR